jgi:hypothetical protein
LHEQLFHKIGYTLRNSDFFNNIGGERTFAATHHSDRVAPKTGRSVAIELPNRHKAERNPELLDLPLIVEIPPAKPYLVARGP